MVVGLVLVLAVIDGMGFGRANKPRRRVVGRAEPSQKSMKRMK
jgi:hypothetical protein